MRTRRPLVVDKLDRFDRRTVAKTLRRARHTALDPDVVDWIHAALPESLAALRLRVTTLLQSADVEAAAALVSTALLRRPGHAGLWHLRAHCALMRARLDDADTAIRTTLNKRPHHAASLDLAAQIALARGETARAIRFIHQGLASRPASAALRERRVESLLACGFDQRAREELEQLDTPSPLLKARVLRSSGALQDAADVLRRACAIGGAYTDLPAAELIDLLDEMGESAEIERLIGQLDAKRPHALYRAAVYCLENGHFARALRLADSLIWSGRLAVEAEWVQCVALASLGRTDRAQRMLDRVLSDPQPIDPQKTAALWRSAMRGQLLRRQRSPHLAGADPSPLQLHAMLERAAATLEDAIDTAETDERDRLRRLCASALNAMGATDRAANMLSPASADDTAGEVHAAEFEPMDESLLRRAA